MNKRVVLLFPPYIEGYAPRYGMPPLGLLYIGTYLKQHGIDATIIDAGMEGLTVEEIKERVLKRNPQFLGISILSHLFAVSVEIVNTIKKANPDIKIVLGGCHINSTLDESFQYANADYLVYGEGEKAMLELVSGKENIEGLITPGHINPPRKFLENLDELPFPDFELIENFDIRRWDGPFVDKKPMVSMMASRGCPYKCAFCDIHKTNGRIHRFRSASNISEEIKRLIEEYKIKYITFKDSTFTVNRGWALELCERLKDFKLHWRCNTRVDLLDEELLEKMKKAGCYTITLGVESGNQRILDLLDKKLTLEQIRKTFKLLEKTDIDIHANFIIGSPTEKEEEALDTIRLAKELNPLFTHFIRGMAYPNTAYYDLGKRFNLIDDKWYIKTKPVSYEASFFTGASGGKIKVDFDADRMIKKAYRQFYMRWGFFGKLMRKIIRNPRFIITIFRGINLLK